MCVTNEEGVTFIYTGPGRCLFRTSVSSSRADLSFGNYIFTVFFLWGRLLFWDLLISSGASSNYLMVSFDFLTSSSLRKVVPEVKTSRYYQKHQHSLLAMEVFSMMFSSGPHSPTGYAMVLEPRHGHTDHATGSISIVTHGYNLIVCHHHPYVKGYNHKTSTRATTSCGLTWATTTM
jgi:hypothetical protein